MTLLLLVSAVLLITVATVLALRRNLARHPRRPQPLAPGDVHLVITADVSGFVDAMTRAGAGVQASAVRAAERAQASAEIVAICSPADAAHLLEFVRTRPWQQRPEAARILVQLAKAGMCADDIAAAGYTAVRRVMRGTDLDVDDAVHAVAEVSAIGRLDGVLILQAASTVTRIRNLGARR